MRLRFCVSLITSALPAPCACLLLYRGFLPAEYASSFVWGRKRCVGLWSFMARRAGMQGASTGTMGCKCTLCLCGTALSSFSSRASFRAHVPFVGARHLRPCTLLCGGRCSQRSPFDGDERFSIVLSARRAHPWGGEMMLQTSHLSLPAPALVPRVSVLAPEWYSAHTR
ncbi:hypothetical protein DFH09DRAFT_1152010 [Mycena vulgaris]|nr:hypothetical protein DFH09DRAFT_1219362 [Mycena vulgaris]KAJ6573510.1 hypothetical protein DFH09DRAFT_1152010 [Mycena vulgaris]